MNKTETRRGEAREEILRSVLELIADSGIESVTHRSAASKTGVSPGTVTYHFSTRDDLIDAALTQYVSEYQAGLAEAVANSPISGREELLGFLVGTTARAPAQLDLATIELEMALLAKRTGRLTGVLQAWQRSMEPILSEVLEGIGVAKPVEAARILSAVCRGSEFEVMSRGVELPVETFRARLSIVLDGLLPAVRPQA